MDWVPGGGFDEFMPDICSDYCEATDCKGCQYENASRTERAEAMEKLFENNKKL